MTAINAIDDLLCYILKIDRWDILSKKLSDLLFKKLSAAQRDVINDAIRVIASGAGTLSEGELQQILSDVENALGKKLEESLSEPVSTYHLRAYKMAFKEIGINFSFNKVSRDALRWMDEDIMYWIGEHYNETLSRQLNDLAAQIAETGYDRESAGQIFRKNLEDQFTRGNHYWEGLSNHIVTRSREFGHIDAYDRAGVEFVKVVAIMDSRTSKICRYMNERILPVSHLRTQRDKLMSAKSPEAAKEVSGWLNDKEAEQFIKDVPTDELITGTKTRMLGLPPYHFNCRTRTVMATSAEIEAYKKS